MTLKEMQERYGQLVAETRKLADVANARADGKFTSEEEVQWKALHDEEQSLDAKIIREKAQVEKESKMKESADRTKELRGSFAGSGDSGERRDRGAPEYATEQRTKDIRSAMRGWAKTNPKRGDMPSEDELEAGRRCGINPLLPEMRLRMHTDNYGQVQTEYRSQTVGTPTAGGYLTQGTLVSSIEYAMLNYDGVRQAAQVIRTSDGNEMRWPTIDDTANQGAQVAEGGTRTTATDIAVGEKVWRAYVYTSDIGSITRELMVDSAFPWESIIGELLSQRIRRKQAVHFTTGDGAGKPTGIVTASTAGVTAASASAIVYDDLIGLEHAVDPDRRNGAGYMFNDAILLALKKLKDGQGQYIWNRDIAGSAPRTISTYPYYINQAMASTMTSGAIIALFGQLSSYKIRDVADVVVRRSDEWGFTTGKVAFIAEMRSDGHLLDAGDHPVKRLTN